MNLNKARIHFLRAGEGMSIVESSKDQDSLERSAYSVRTNLEEAIKLLDEYVEKAFQILPPKK